MLIIEHTAKPTFKSSERFIIQRVAIEAVIDKRHMTHPFRQGTGNELIIPQKARNTMYDKIRELARDRGTSIPKIEEACGLSNGAISKWSVSSPKVENLKKVADFLGVTLDYFVTEQK